LANIGQYILAVGGVSPVIVSGRPLVGVRLENFTTQYAHLIEPDVFVDPGAKGVLVALGGLTHFRAEFKAPPGKTQPTKVNGQQLFIYAYPESEVGAAAIPFQVNPGVVTPATDTNDADITAVGAADGGTFAGTVGLAADAGHIHTADIDSSGTALGVRVRTAAGAANQSFLSGDNATPPTPGAQGSLYLQSTHLSPVGARIGFGTDNSGWRLAIAKQVAAAIVDLLDITDGGSTNAPRFLFMPSLIGAPGGLEIDANVGSSPISGRIVLGTDNTGWQLRIAKNAAGVFTDMVYFPDAGSILIPPAFGVATAPTAYGSLPIKVGEFSGTGPFTFTVRSWMRHLIMYSHVRANSAGSPASFGVRFNGDSGTNYAGVFLTAGGGAALTWGAESSGNTLARAGMMPGNTLSHADCTTEILRANLAGSGSTRQIRSDSVWANGLGTSLTYAKTMDAWNSSAVLTSLTLDPLGILDANSLITIYAWP